MNETGRGLHLYIKADKLVEVTESRVTLDTLVNMECGDKYILGRLKALTLLQFEEKKYTRTVISILKILECIHQIYPELTVVNLGEIDIIVIYDNQKKVPKWWHVGKAYLVGIVVFIGAAYSIIAFSNDVDTLGIFDFIYGLLLEENVSRYGVLEASYSIGLVLGILIFFNHLGKRKLTVDPTPMEIEMRLYEQDIQTTLIQNYARRGEEIESGQLDNIKYHRDQ